MKTKTKPTNGTMGKAHHVPKNNNTKAVITKSQPTAKILGFKIGGKDNVGHVITDILASGNEFVIYEIETEDINKKLKVFIDGVTDASERKLISNFTAVKENYIIAKGLLYRSTNFGTMKNRVAHSLATALHDDPGKANEQFIGLIREINKEYVKANRSRLIYMVPGYGLLTLFTIILLFNSLFTRSQAYIQIKEIIEWICFSYASIIGCVFSLTLSLPKMKFDSEISEFIYLVYGMERVSISILAGIILISGIRANIVFPSLSDATNNFWTLFFLIIMVAFSEKMIPNILMKFSEKEH